jgi:hypothetical protein
MNPPGETSIVGDMISRFAAVLLTMTCALQCQTNSPSAPDASEQQRVLSDAGEYAINHEANLPNFECTQTTRRFEDFNNSGWRPIDRIVERLTYFDHREVYKVMTLNGQPASIAHDQLRGASSSGEFGSVMRSIFLPQTETEFVWQDWSAIRGKKMHVYGYRVRAFKSSYRVEVPEKSLDLVTGYHGLIFIDSEQHRVHRITLQADEIPLTFPIQDISLTLDYDYTRIGDGDFLLPLQFELRSREGIQLIRNYVEYDNYRKFNVVSVITYGSQDALKK